jgi:long-chain acyl-CoA synthetase
MVSPLSIGLATMCNASAAYGEEVKAVVQPGDMREADPELERELIPFCRERLSPIKCPRSIDFVRELPRYPTGKLYKRLLRDRYWAATGSNPPSELGNFTPSH